MAALGGQAPIGVLLVLVGDQARVPVEGAVGRGGGLVDRAGLAGLDGASGRAGLAGLASPTGADGAGARGQVGQAQADEGTDEDPLLLVLEEVGEHPPRLGIGEREGRRQVVDDGASDAFGLEAGKEESHDWGAGCGWWGLGCGAGAVSAGTLGPPRLRADRRSGTGIPQVRGYRRGRGPRSMTPGLYLALFFLTWRGRRLVVVIDGENLERFIRSTEDLADIEPFSPEPMKLIQRVVLKT